MKRFKYVFYRYWQRKVDEYFSFEDALHNYIFDFDHCVAYGIGIYDQESKILYLPDFFNKEQRNRSIKEIENWDMKLRKLRLLRFEIEDE